VSLSPDEERVSAAPREVYDAAQTKPLCGEFWIRETPMKTGGNKLQGHRICGLALEMFDA